MLEGFGRWFGVTDFSLYEKVILGENFQIIKLLLNVNPLWLPKEFEKHVLLLHFNLLFLKYFILSLFTYILLKILLTKNINFKNDVLIININFLILLRLMFN